MLVSLPQIQQTTMSCIAEEMLSVIHYPIPCVTSLYKSQEVTK